MHANYKPASSYFQKAYAHFHYQQALKISNENNFTKEMGAVYLELGYLRDEWGENQAAEKSCSRAIEICETIGNLHALAGAYCNMGKAIETRGDFDGAVDWYKKGQKLYEQIGIEAGEAYPFLRLGVLMRKLNFLEDANQFLEKARKLCERHGLKETLENVSKEIQAAQDSTSGDS